MNDQDLLQRFGRRVRLGMVGGGSDSIIGRTHLIALRTDGLCELVAGAMSVDPAIARASGQGELLAAERIYTDYRRMAEVEAARPDRIDAVVIATPPQLHFPVASLFLEHGIDVICEKPMTRTAAEAVELVRLVRRSGRLFCLTHCYSGYPMVRQARAMVAAGAIGRVRMIEVEFSSGDPGVALEPADPTRRHWRFRAGSMGKAAILGEVGSHSHHIAGYVGGCDAEAVAATLAIFAAHREVYDNAYLTLRFAGGVQGRIWNSYVAVGQEHGLAFRIFGEAGSLQWHQESPEVLWHRPIGAPALRLSRGQDGLAAASLAAARFRPGHPEGYALAFANLYADFARALMTRGLGLPHQPVIAGLPGVEDGAKGMALIEAAARSHDRDGAWTDCRVAF